MTTLPIPKLYWDVFQGALQTKMKRLAKEVAASLGQPEQPLLKALLTEKVEAYLFEEEGSEFVDLPSMRCKHLVTTSENTAVLMPCRQPILLGKTACLLHQTQQMDTPPLPVFRTVKDIDTGNSYWVDANNSVRDKTSLALLGIYRETDNKVIIFNVTS